MGRMVGNGKFLFNDSGDHRACPYAPGESIRQRPAVQDVGKFPFPILGQGWGTTGPMPLQTPSMPCCCQFRSQMETLER